MCFLRRLLALLILCGPAVALAQSSTAPFVGLSADGPKAEITRLTTASSRSTTCIPVKGWRFLKLDHEVDRDESPTVTAAATTCYGYNEDSCADTIPKQLPMCIDNTCSVYAPSWAIDADEGWSYRFDVSGFLHMKCTVSFTNGDAGDVITVKSTRIRE